MQKRNKKFHEVANNNNGKNTSQTSRLKSQNNIQNLAADTNQKTQHKANIISDNANDLLKEQVNPVQFNETIEHDNILLNRKFEEKLQSKTNKDSGKDQKQNSFDKKSIINDKNLIQDLISEDLGDIVTLEEQIRTLWKSQEWENKFSGLKQNNFFKAQRKINPKQKRN